MTEEEARELEQAYADLKEQAAQKDQRIEELEAYLMRALLRIEELERRLAKDSHNSSKPPSSDGLGRKPGKQRKKSGKLPGGQKGHAGQSLLQVLTPDEVISHRPRHCEACQFDLREEPGRVKERRPMHDLPDLREAACRSITWKKSAALPVSIQRQDDFQREWMLLPTMVLVCNRWRCICRNFSCCPWNGLVRRSKICVSVISRKERWAIGWQKLLKS